MFVFVCVCSCACTCARLSVCACDVCCSHRYDADENSATADDASDKSAKFLGDAAKFAAKAAEFAKRMSRDNEQQVKRISAQQQARQEAANRWEEQQLMNSGLVFFVVTSFLFFG